MENAIHIMTTNTLRNRASIAHIARFVKKNTQKVLVEFKASSTKNEFMESVCSNNGILLVKVSRQQKSTSATPP